MRTIFLGLALFLNLGVQATTVPLYLAYSIAPEPTDITANAYGASRLAPDAFGIGEIAPDFDLPLSNADAWRLRAATSTLRGYRELSLAALRK